ncbi:hypothetical protein AVEN_233350-1 [Araneus ventricosus]|uniref:Uncharacterized protein n=1 Tax=Araneus ventricosus TaxID=182803 RepID=A0A4Y2D8R3_ARAVE|nr:hypothetical protein AVEN_233350-1 [Araneus ventricosus]
MDANEGGTSYLFTRDYYYKKDVSAWLYVKAEGYGKIWHYRVMATSYTADHLKSCKTFKETGCVTSRPRVRRPRNVGRKVQPEDLRVYSGTPGWVGRRHFFRWLTTGKVTSPNPTGGTRIDPMIAYAPAHPQSSTKMISENCGLSKSRVWTILNESGAHPHLCRDWCQEMLIDVTRGATL